MDSTVPGVEGSGGLIGVDPMRVRARFAGNIPGVVLPLVFGCVAGGVGVI